MSSDWRKRLRRASFRGAHFWVDNDGVRGGRRVAIHEFPNSEVAFNEDLGQQVRTYDVDAYVVGDSADSEASSLVSACTSPLAATLVLPLFGTIRAKCLEINSNRSKDKHGFVAFRLRFVAEGLELSALGGTPHLRSRAKNRLKTLPPILAVAARSSLATVGDRSIPGSVSVLAPLPDFVFNSAVNTCEHWLAQVALEVSNAELRGNLAAKLDRSVSDLYSDLAELVAIGAHVNKYGDTSFVASDDEAGAMPLANRTFGLLDEFRVAMEPSHAVLVFKSLADFGDDLDAIPQTTINRKIEAENQETLVNLFRRSALAQLAAALVDKTYTSRREAIAARADVSERFTEELNKISRADQWEVGIALREILGFTVEYLSKVMADLAPVIVVGADVRMPSIYWAYRLYGDATRADELSERNDIKHPMWMGTEFEALAR